MADDKPGAAESWAYLVQGGRARSIDTEAAHDTSRPEGALLWLHLHGPDVEGAPWRALAGDVPDAALAAMIAAETRPRCDPIGEGALLNLRGVGEASLDSADPLVSIRLWMQQGRVISVTRGRIDALETLCGAVKAGRVSDPGELAATLAGAISKQLDRVIADLGDRLDDAEERLAGEGDQDLSRDTAAIRARAIAFRRFVAPDRAALDALGDLPCDWLDDHDRTEVREAANRFARMTEELEAIRERAALVSEQLSEARASLLERRSFIIAIVSLVFLPLTFFTGLLGINVEGIWYAEHPQAFNGVLIVCATIALVLTGFFFAAHWFRR